MYEKERQDIAADKPERYMSTGKTKKSNEVKPETAIAEKRVEMGLLRNDALNVIPLLPWREVGCRRRERAGCRLWGLIFWASLPQQRQLPNGRFIAGTRSITSNKEADG